MSPKQEIEQAAIDLASPTLSRLYGEFERDPDQLDRPDGAFVVRATSERIGVEVTTCDAEEDLEYLNGAQRKTAKDAMRRINGGLSGQPLDHSPQKRLTVDLDPEAIVNRLQNLKEAKFAEYVETGCDDVVLLVTSEHLDRTNPEFHEIATQVEYLLGTYSFPYAWVIFACQRTQQCEQLYDRSNPLSTAPIQRSRETSVTISHITGTIGAKMNLNDAFELPPSMPPKARGE